MMKAIAVVLALAAVPALAQGLPGATPERREAALALAEQINGGSMMAQMVTAMRDSLVQAITTADQSREQVAAILDEVLLPEIRGRSSELVAAIAEIWAANLSVEDLQELRAFYASPLGQRVLASMPAIAQQSAQAGVAWGQRVATEALTRNRDALRARGLRL